MKITVELSEKATKYFKELKYSLSKNKDGSGIANNSQCINYCLELLSDFEDIEQEDLYTYLAQKKNK